jgi:hypothetical protein
MLTFHRTENIQKLHEITDIRGMKVEVTPYGKTKLLPQWKNCQSWGHTKAYCHKEPRCFKCAGKHTTVSCTKPRETPSKCYNCGKNNPANCRGCIVAKELQALRNKAANKMKLTSAGKNSGTNEKCHPNPPQTRHRRTLMLSRPISLHRNDNLPLTLPRRMQFLYCIIRKRLSTNNYTSPLQRWISKRRYTRH